MDSAWTWSDITDALTVIGVLIVIIVIFELVRFIARKRSAAPVSSATVELSNTMLADIKQTIKQGDLKEVLTFLEKNPDSVNWNLEFLMEDKPYNLTLLYLAVQFNQPKIIKLLVVKGADVNERAGKGNQTALEMAIVNGDFGLVEFLLAHGGKYGPEYGNNSGELGTLLREYPAKHNYKTIHEAVENCSVLGVRDFVRREIDLSETDEDGQTPLHIAAVKNCPEITRILVNSGARIHAKNEFGNTPLHVANFYRHKDVAHILRLKGGEN